MLQNSTQGCCSSTDTKSTIHTLVHAHTHKAATCRPVLQTHTGTKHTPEACANHPLQPNPCAQLLATCKAIPHASNLSQCILQGYRSCYVLATVNSQCTNASTRASPKCTHKCPGHNTTPPHFEVPKCVEKFHKVGLAANNIVLTHTPSAVSQRTIKHAAQKDTRGPKQASHVLKSHHQPRTNTAACCVF